MLIIIDVQTGERLKVFTQMPSYSTKSSMKEVFSHPQGNMDTGIMETAEKTVCPDFFHCYSELFIEIDETGHFWGSRLI
ncbi:hypothetical protein [Paenibacillus monticola]|nr:hypothetical protein [Paenibacillus monticola]